MSTYGLLVTFNNVIAQSDGAGGLIYSGNFEIPGLELMFALVIGGLVALGFWLSLKTG